MFISGRIFKPVLRRVNHIKAFENRVMAAWRRGFARRHPKQTGPKEMFENAHAAQKATRLC